MELSEAMRTTFAAREFTDDPVDDAALYRILDNARFAPSGGNRQGWRVIAIRDRTAREQLAAWVEPTMKRYFAQQAAGESPWNPLHPPGPDADAIAAVRLPRVITGQLVEAPVLLAVCVDLGLLACMDQDLDRIGIVGGGSVYPFCWNILLAAREEGLGGTMTTFIAPHEPEVQELLGIPGHYAVAALIPIGRPAQRLTKLRRKPVEEFATLERFDGAPLVDREG